jgi:hypothetical protein
MKKNSRYRDFRFKNNNKSKVEDYSNKIKEDLIQISRGVEQISLIKMVIAEIKSMKMNMTVNMILRIVTTQRIAIEKDAEGNNNKVKTNKRRSMVSTMEEIAVVVYQKMITSAKLIKINNQIEIIKQHHPRNSKSLNNRIKEIIRNK